ncbi:retrovirus-related pol polyprotein from transposon TNT 1-94 [Tanacetum coccineum]
MDVNENMMENKEHGDDEDLLEIEKMNKDVKEAMAQEFVMGDLGLKSCKEDFTIINRDGRERNYGGRGFGHSRSGGRGYDHGTESHSYDSNNYGKPGHYARNYRFPNMVEDGANDCYNCGKFGHYTRDCRLPKRVEENTNLVIEEEKVDGIVMMAYEEVVEEEALMAYEDVIGIDTQWYLDTAARNHMCSDKGLFSEMKEAVDGSVSFVDEAKVQVKEAGTICFSHTGKQIPTEDEYHVPILNTKLEWCSQNNQNVMVKRVVKVKEEGGNEKVHEESAWKHKNQNVVDGQQ